MAQHPNSCPPATIYSIRDAKDCIAGLFEPYVSFFYGRTVTQMIRNIQICNIFRVALRRTHSIASLFATLRAERRYINYSRGEVFRPAGATRCTDGVKFGMREWTHSMPNLAPIGTTIRV